MVRISKLADYAVIITGWLADQTEARTIEDIAAGTHLPVATVRKLTRLLTRAGICSARKGPHGGYRLAMAPEDITLLAVVESVEGEITLTECARQTGCDCALMPHCHARGGWQIINRILRSLFAQLRIADVAGGNLGDSRIMAHLLDVRQVSGTNQRDV